MNGIGDSDLDFDLKKETEYMEFGNEAEYVIKNQPWLQAKYYDINILKSAQKTFSFLEHQSLVDFVEADGQYIVSTGRDHDINVWDACEYTHIRRLSGHTGPVTGLYVTSWGQEPIDHIVVTSSEDGTIRQWSLNRGEELRKFETNTLLTCMGVMNQILAVTGNNQGYMEIRHLSTGEIYTSVLAHQDPIDAIVVEGNNACSATFDPPSCLKVWEIQFEQTICIYRIENLPTIEFGSLAISDTRVILGATDEPKLHIINFKTDERGIIDLEKPTGNVQHVSTVKGWILTCSTYGENVILDVHRIDNYEHFGTFSCNIHQVYAITVMETDSSLKIILGGSALAVLYFDFTSVQEMAIISNRIIKSEKLSLIQKRRKGHYTIRNRVNENCIKSEKLKHSSDSSETSGDCIPYANISVESYPTFDEFQCRMAQEHDTQAKKGNFEKDNHITEKLNEFSVFESKQSKPLLKHTLVHKLESNEHVQLLKEPRMVLKKLEEILDENNKNNNMEVSKDTYTSIGIKDEKNEQTNIYEKIFHEGCEDQYFEKTEKELNTVQRDEKEIHENAKGSKELLLLKDDEWSAMQQNEQRKVKDNTNNLNDIEDNKFNKIKKDKIKKKRHKQKHSCKKCLIM